MSLIHDALIVPHERPPSLRDVKRALLTYDKVILIDPADRDLLPSNTFSAAVFGQLGAFFGVPVGPVRPLGKVATYDAKFSELVDSLLDAGAQSSISVVSTYDRSVVDKLSIGGVPTGGYPLNPSFVYHLYRSMANDASFLSRAGSPALLKLLQESDSSSGLICDGIADTQSGALPLVGASDCVDEAHIEAFTKLCRGRIASFIKHVGYCHAKELVPVLEADAYGRITEGLLNNASSVLAFDNEGKSLQRRSRVLELCHEEFLREQALDQMSVKDVLKLRTVAWGKQSEARDHLFKSVSDIATENGSHEDFVERVRTLLSEYRRASQEVVREREALSFQLKCELGSAVLMGGVAVVGLLSQVSMLASIGITLAAGGVWAFDKAKSYVPHLRQIEAKEAEMGRGAGLGLHNFYSRIP